MMILNRRTLQAGEQDEVDRHADGQADVEQADPPSRVNVMMHNLAIVTVGEHLWYHVSGQMPLAS